MAMKTIEKDTTATRFRQFIIDEVEEKNTIISELRKGNKDVFTKKGKTFVQPIPAK